MEIWLCCYFEQSTITSQTHLKTIIWEFISAYFRLSKKDYCKNISFYWPLYTSWMTCSLNFAVYDQKMHNIALLREKLTQGQADLLLALDSSSTSLGPFVPMLTVWQKVGNPGAEYMMVTLKSLYRGVYLQTLLVLTCSHQQPWVVFLCGADSYYFQIFPKKMALADATKDLAFIAKNKSQIFQLFCNCCQSFTEILSESSPIASLT